MWEWYRTGPWWSRIRYSSKPDETGRADVTVQYGVVRRRFRRKSKRFGPDGASDSVRKRNESEKERLSCYVRHFAMAAFIDLTRWLFGIERSCAVTVETISCYTSQSRLSRATSTIGFFIQLNAPTMSGLITIIQSVANHLLFVHWWDDEKLISIGHTYRQSFTKPISVFDFLTH